MSSRIPFPILTLLARATNIKHGASTRLGSENVAFHYLYRDAGNYKLRGTAIFSNHTLLTLEEIEQQIRSFLKDGEFFIARQVDIEERFFDVVHEEEDHPWHTFDHVEHTTEPAFDPGHREEHLQDRDITEFIADLATANRAGWDEMKVRPDLAAMMKRQKDGWKRDLNSGRVD